MHMRVYMHPQTMLCSSLGTLSTILTLGTPLTTFCLCIFPYTALRAGNALPVQVLVQEQRHSRCLNQRFVEGCMGPGAEAHSVSVSSPRWAPLPLHGPLSLCHQWLPAPPFLIERGIVWF